MPDLYNRLSRLAARYYDLLEDQLYDPQQGVDFYGKEQQRRHIISLLRDLAHEARVPAWGDPPEPVKLNEHDEPLCPECGGLLFATVVSSECEVPYWEYDTWMYVLNGGDSDIESFDCPECGWSATDVEPQGKL